METQRHIINPNTGLAIVSDSSGFFEVCPCYLNRAFSDYKRDIYASSSHLVDNGFSLHTGPEYVLRSGPVQCCPCGAREPGRHEQSNAVPSQLPRPEGRSL
jgi:hypothetical protein